METLNLPPVDMERAALEQFAQAAMNGEAFPVAGEQAINGIAGLEAMSRSGERRTQVTIQ